MTRVLNRNRIFAIPVFETVSKVSKSTYITHYLQALCNIARTLQEQERKSWLQTSQEVSHSFFLLNKMIEQGEF